MDFFSARPGRGLYAFGTMCALALGFVSTSARAEIPPLELRWTVNNVLLYDDTPAGSDNGDGTYGYDGLLADGDLAFYYSVKAGPDGRLGVGVTTFVNTTLESIDVVFEAFLPIAPIQGDTTVTGSAAFGLTTTPDGGTLASLVGEPAWRASIDGAPVMDLLDPLEITNPGIGSPPVAFENRGPEAGPQGVTNSIAVQVSFSLTPGAAMSMTSVFNVVPEPGSLALLAMVGAALRPRRRRR